MPIEVANPLTDIDEDDFTEEGEGTQYNMRELMDLVYKSRDLIFTLPADQVSTLKNGLIIRKGKDNLKLKRAELPPDNQVLSFFVYAAKDEKGQEREGIADVRVKLGPKKSVQILEVRIPSDEF